MRFRNEINFTQFTKRKQNTGFRVLIAST